MLLALADEPSQDRVLSLDFSFCGMEELLYGPSHTQLSSLMILSRKTNTSLPPLPTHALPPISSPEIGGVIVS